MTQRIRWGILGAGDVCEVKSGPAFQKGEHSELVAVMRRDAAKAEDFARRHGVGRWYDSTDELLADPAIDAVYVATPPRHHVEHACAVLEAGKHLYLEKPMGMNADECRQIIAQEEKSPGKVALAHYRRALPAFKKVRELIEDGTLGDIRLAEVNFLLPPKNQMMPADGYNWRIIPEVSGGGQFHDLSPHLFDLLLVYFGNPIKSEGFTLRQNPDASADDFVQGTILFDNGIVFRGCWCFSVAESAATELIQVTGTKGSVSSTFFGDEIRLRTAEGEEVIQFTNPENIQLPMIEEVSHYFLGERDCPCSTADGLQVMQLIDRFSRQIN